MKNTDISLKSIDFKPPIKKLSKRFGKHALFAAIVAVLITYLLVVFEISMLAKAEPSPDQTSEITSSIPKVDKNAVSQIQSLEQSNTAVHTLFESARNNPFQE
jgi:cell division protein FtsN